MFDKITTCLRIDTDNRYSRWRAQSRGKCAEKTSERTYRIVLHLLLLSGQPSHENLFALLRLRVQGPESFIGVTQGCHLACNHPQCKATVHPNTAPTVAPELSQRTFRTTNTTPTLTRSRLPILKAIADILTPANYHRPPMGRTIPTTRDTSRHNTSSHWFVHFTHQLTSNCLYLVNNLRLGYLNLSRRSQAANTPSKRTRFLYFYVNKFWLRSSKISFLFRCNFKFVFWDFLFNLTHARCFLFKFLIWVISIARKNLLSTI